MRLLMIDVSPLRSSAEFRLVFAARVVSLFGIALTTVGVPWQVYDMTRSSLHVSLAAALVGTTTLVGTLAGGVVADRWDRRKIILASRGAAAIVFGVLAVNAAVPNPQLWILYVCVALNGATAVSQSALMAVTPAIVRREQLAAAGALVALSTQIGAVVGPSVAGLLIAGPGLAVNFGLCAVASAVTTTLLWFLPPLRPSGAITAHPLESLREGAGFVVRNRVVRGVLLVDVAAMLFALPQVLFPQVVVEVLEQGPQAAGLLYTAPAVGAMIAALTSGWTTAVRRTGRVLLIAVGLYGAAIAGFGLSGSLAWALPFLAVAGAADMISEILRRALLADATPDHLQGRVSSVWLAQATVGPSAGGVEAGVASRLLGPGPAIAAGGAVCVVATAALAGFLPPLRRASLHSPQPEDEAAVEPVPGITEHAPLEPEVVEVSAHEPEQR